MFRHQLTTGIWLKRLSAEAKAEGSEHGAQGQSQSKGEGRC